MQLTVCNSKLDDTSVSFVCRFSTYKMLVADGVELWQQEHGILMARVWNMCGIWMGYVWNANGICTEYARHAHETCMK